MFTSWVIPWQPRWLQNPGSHGRAVSAMAPTLCKSQKRHSSGVISRSRRLALLVTGPDDAELRLDPRAQGLPTACQREALCSGLGWVSQATSCGSGDRFLQAGVGSTVPALSPTAAPTGCEQGPVSATGHPQAPLPRAVGAEPPGEGPTLTLQVGGQLAQGVVPRRSADTAGSTLASGFLLWFP